MDCFHYKLVPHFPLRLLECVQDKGVRVKNTSCTLDTLFLPIKRKRERERERREGRKEGGGRVGEGELF